MENIQEEKKKKKRKILVLLLLILLLFGGYAYFKDSGGLRFEGDQEEGSLDGKTAAEIQELMKQKVEEGSFAISINTLPKFKDGNSKGSLRIENAPENRYLMIVKLHLKDSDELIYESGAIKPGFKLESAKLDKVLDNGTYQVIAYFEAYDLETNNFVGKAASDMSIVIGEEDDE